MRLELRDLAVQTDFLAPEAAWIDTRFRYVPYYLVVPGILWLFRRLLLVRLEGLSLC
jgi:hypothetical protein